MTLAKKIKSFFIDISWQLMGLLAFIVIVSGIVCLAGRISGEQFLNIIFTIIGLIGGYYGGSKRSLEKN